MPQSPQTTNATKVEQLIDHLLTEMPQYREQAADFTTPEERRRLLRSLMNVRPPLPLDPAFVALQDEVLSEECTERGIVHVADIPSSPVDPRIALWQGDIVRLDADAIVNAANDALLGCFYPCHGCIDNAIHSAAGLELRDACARIMNDQGHPEATGTAKITPAFNLPSRYVLHTVGPIVRNGHPTQRDRDLLASCYTSCLELVCANNLHSIAFCCISTGEFGYPNEPAAEVAVATVRAFLATHESYDLKVVFNVFKDLDRRIYERLLGYDN